MGYDALLFNRLDELSLWVKKLEVTNDLHISPVLFLNIMRNVEEAFVYDFNMIIEEFDFYYSLTPKMQTDLVNFLFAEFKKEHATFFDPCEVGFTNELIVNLTAFLMSPNHELAKPGIKMDMFYFISEGFVSVTGPQSLKPFLILPQYSYLGDY